MLLLGDMPSRHARIALTRDPELDAALAAAAPLVDATTTAGLARELILRGAQAVTDDPAAELDRWLTERGATPASGSVSDLVTTARSLGPVDPADPTPLTDVLDDVRADRI